jgi:hypothetical protein
VTDNLAILCRDLRKHYPDVKAVDDFDLRKHNAAKWRRMRALDWRGSNQARTRDLRRDRPEV